jgi:hypothetical protein
MSASGNPTTCETITGGVRCTNPSTYVMRMATKTRIICDDCVRQYRASVAAGAKAGAFELPIAEISWAEIKPAREDLLRRLAEAEANVATGVMVELEQADVIDGLNGRVLDLTKRLENECLQNAEQEIVVAGLRDTKMFLTIALARLQTQHEIVFWGGGAAVAASVLFSADVGRWWGLTAGSAVLLTCYIGGLFVKGNKP